jgi:hypothetical protein
MSISAIGARAHFIGLALWLGLFVSSGGINFTLLDSAVFLIAKKDIVKKKKLAGGDPRSYPPPPPLSLASCLVPARLPVFFLARLPAVHRGLAPRARLQGEASRCPLDAAVGAGVPVRGRR